MKKLILLVTMAVATTFSNAQTVTSLAETFNVSCASVGPNYPLYWTQWNIIPPVAALAWNCTPAGGRYGSAGIQCNSYISGVHYLDTAWLFTPRLDLSGYADSIYLRFDSRYDVSGARMQVVINPTMDSVQQFMDSPYVNYWTDAETYGRMSPVIGPDDSAGWVTHYVNLTHFKSTPIYVAFRYASTNTTGGAWTIDNVFLTPWGLNVNEVNRHTMKLSILGTTTSSELSFAGNFPVSGNYNVQLYDNIGRTVYSGQVYATSGNSSHTITGLGLRSDIYFLRVGNETAYTVASAMVR